MLDRRMLFAALAALAVQGLALAPAPAFADDLDDLDVTMEVLDSEAEVDVLVKQMRGPEQSDAGRPDAAEEPEPAAAETSPFREDGEADGFEREQRTGDSDLLHEDDFETDEGEDLELDKLPEEDYEEPHY